LNNAASQGGSAPNCACASRWYRPCLAPLPAAAAGVRAAALVLPRRELAQQKGRLQQVEQFDMREIVHDAFQPAVDHRGGGSGRQRPAGFVGDQHVGAFEQRAHPACGFAVERDQRDIALSSVQSRRHPGGDGARLGFQVRCRAQRQVRVHGRAG